MAVAGADQTLAKPPGAVWAVASPRLVVGAVPSVQSCWPRKLKQFRACFLQNPAFSAGPYPPAKGEALT